VSFSIGFCIFLFIGPGFAGDLGAIQIKEISGQKNPETGCKKYSYQYYSSDFDSIEKLKFYQHSLVL
jgi:hypothetical protein